jgi:hypothetical protein
VRAPIAVSFLAARPELLETDERSAAATRLARALVDVGTATRSQITGGGLLGTPAVCLQHQLSTLDNAPQVADVTDRGTRMYAMEEEQLRSIERAETCEVPLVQQGLTNPTVGLIGDPPDCLVEVPVGSEQIGPEMTYDFVLGRRGNHLDDREPVSHCIMITGREYRADFKRGSATPPPAARVDLPGAVHSEMRVQRELIAEPKQLVLAARDHLAYANAGQIGCRQGGHPEFGSGQHAAGKHLVQPLACPPDRISLRHGLIVPCGSKPRASEIGGFSTFAPPICRRRWRNKAFPFRQI